MNSRLQTLLADTIGLDATTITAATAMTNTPQWDSVMHLNVCLAVEGEFGVTFEPDEMVALNSVAAIETALAKRGAV